MRRRARIAALAIALGTIALAAAAPGAGATAQPRVYGGSPAPLPGWMGFIVVLEGSNVALCDGTAIAPNVLLTANHCVVDETTNRYVSPSQIRVVFGQEDPRGAILAHTAVPVSVVRYDSPDRYGVYANGLTQNDISLLELAQPAPSTISVVPTSRPNLWSAGRSGLVLGWGLTRDGDQSSAPSQLLSAAMPIESDSYCRSIVPNFSATSMMCAGDGTGSAPCQGDSGGPLLVSDGANGLYEAGVVNTGTTCQDLGGPNVFARIGGTSLGTWIATYAAQLQADATARGRGAQPTTSASAPAPSAPKTTQASGGLSAGEVPRDLRRALASAMGQRFAHESGLRSSCRRQSASQFRCTAAWYKRPNDYYATVQIFLRRDAARNAPVLGYTGSFESVNHRCNAGPNRQNCRITTYP